MPTIEEHINHRPCAKVEPPHPCDPPPPCDPHQEEEGACPEPYVCYERIKNPEEPNWTTKCRQGNFLSVKSCAKVEPPHPCDSLIPCAERPHKESCSESMLCSEKIKNPSGKKIFEEQCFDDRPTTSYVDQFE